MLCSSTYSTYINTAGSCNILDLPKKFPFKIIEKKVK